jgi:hypothetical protein
MEPFYIKKRNSYYKVFKNRYVVVHDFDEIPTIDTMRTERKANFGDEEITWNEFYKAFDKVHQKLRDSLLDIEYIVPAVLTRNIASLVNQYDANCKYIEDGAQRRTQERKNAEILTKLAALGVKRFEGINV